MDQVIIAGYDTNPDWSAVEYNALAGGIGWRETETEAIQLVSTGGKIKYLRVKLETAPGAGKDYTFTLMVNGVASALEVTISDTATTGADTTHEVDVVAGDYISIRSTPTSLPTAGWVTWTSIFVGSTSKESLILGSSYSAVSNTATAWNHISTAYISWGTEADRWQVIPTSGKIKNLYVKLSEDPGTAPDAYKFTLRVNGADTVLTCTITADDTTGNDTTHEVSVSAGDYVTLQCEPLNEPTATPHAHWGMTFVADIDGESLLINGARGELHSAATQFNRLSAIDDAWDATEADRHQLGQSCTLKKFYVLLSGTPGDGKSYTFTLRKPNPANGMMDGNLTVTIADAATTGNDTVNTDAISDLDLLSLECTPAGTPSARDAYWGLVGYIAPAAPPPGLENKSANMAAKMMAAGVL